MARTTKKAAHKRTASGRTGRKMSKAQAGRLGGLAPHKCRGSECTKRARRSSRSYSY